MMSTSFGGIPIVLRMFQRELRSRDSKAALRSVYRQCTCDGSQMTNQSSRSGSAGDVRGIEQCQCSIIHAHKFRASLRATNIVLPN